MPIMNTQRIPMSKNSFVLLLMAQRMGVETDQFGDSNKGIEV